VPIESGKDKFFAELETLIAKAKSLQTSGFDEQEPEAATCNDLIRPLLDALGFRTQNIKPEFKILGDSVDYLLKSERPLIFVEAKSLLDKAEDLFAAHQEQVLRYIRNYRVSPEQTEMERPVTWIVLTNFAQWHFIRVNEAAPTFSFKLDALWPQREKLWELLALENLEAGASSSFTTSGTRPRWISAFSPTSNAGGSCWPTVSRSAPVRPLPEIVRASQQLLNRFILCACWRPTGSSSGTNSPAPTRITKLFTATTRKKPSPRFCVNHSFRKSKEIQHRAVRAAAAVRHPAARQPDSRHSCRHEPLSPEIAAQCGFESGHGELLAFRHLYNYDFSLMSSDVMGGSMNASSPTTSGRSAAASFWKTPTNCGKKEGIYYTPHYIVDYIVAHTLGEKIKPILAEAKRCSATRISRARSPKSANWAKSRCSIRDGFRFVPARAFDALIAAYSDYNAGCQRYKKERNGGGTLFDAPDEIAQSVENAALHVLTENLFGVTWTRRLSRWPSSISGSAT